MRVREKNKKHFLGWIELGNCEIIQEIYFEFIMISRRDEKTIKRTQPLFIHLKR